jgi:Nucleotidyltransferase domain
MTLLDTDLWLYGSRARGDADSDSDTDVLLVSDDPAEGELWGSRLDGASVSQYSWSEAVNMAAYGSLFLDHVKRDGRRLVSKGRGKERFDELLASLGAYRRAMTDLRSFKAAIADCRQSLGDGGWPDYELEVAVTVMRHAALLVAYCAGRPDYGRESAFVTVGALLGYSESVVGSLQTSYRMYRRSAPTRPDVAACRQTAPAVLDLAERFLTDSEEVITTYAKAPQAPARDPRRQ